MVILSLHYRMLFGFKRAENDSYLEKNLLPSCLHIGLKYD